MVGSKRNGVSYPEEESTKRGVLHFKGYVESIMLRDDNITREFI
jgi:hypothetical protein